MKEVEALVARFQDEAKLLNQRMGNLSYGTIVRMVRDQAVTGMIVTAAEPQAKTRKTYKTCVLAKHAADPHRESNSCEGTTCADSLRIDGTDETQVSQRYCLHPHGGG